MKPIVQTSAVVILLLLVGSCAATKDTVVSPHRKIAAGDSIWILDRRERMYDPDNLFVVNQDGEVHLPYLGRVRLGGLTAEEAEKAVDHLYVEKNLFRDPRTLVEFADACDRRLEQ